MTEKTELQKQRQAQVDEAREKYEITSQGANLCSVYVNAECGTGSRYAVVVTKIPFMGKMQEGGSHLITVLQPWQTSCTFELFPGEEIHESYIVEKLLPRNRDAERVHGGDLYGLVATVNQAAKHWHFLTQAALDNHNTTLLREVRRGEEG